MQDGPQPDWPSFGMRRSLWAGSTPGVDLDHGWKTDKNSQLPLYRYPQNPSEICL